MARAVSTSAFTPSRIIILTLLISIILLTVTQDQIASAIHAVARPRTCSPFPSSSTDEQKLAPDLRHIPRTFRHIKHLEDLSQEADEEWRATLSTPKGGFLFVENKNKEEREGKDEPWGISMFHAVHCLTMLRSSFQTFMGNGTTTTMNGHAHHQDPRLVKSGQYEAQDAMHVGHCFSYIAQYVMCTADSTIEPPQKSYDEDGKLVEYHVDGEGYQHRCRDPSLIWEAVMRSEKKGVKAFDWTKSDTVESVFGDM